MSPELFDPDFRGNRRTKRSDCYALGMVIYEVLSGRLPFYKYENFVVPLKVFQGSRPERPDGPEGVWFKDDVWAVLERCWASQPNERPTIKDVLQCLEEASRVWTPPSPQAVAIPAVTNSPTWNPFDITPNTDGGEASHPLSAANFLKKVADWDGNSPDIDQTLAAAFEADDYLDCIKDLKAQNIEPLSYVNGLDKVSSYSILNRCT
jgi:serine/threonine protein kinase